MSLLLSLSIPHPSKAIDNSEITDDILQNFLRKICHIYFQQQLCEGSVAIVSITDRKES